MSRILVALSGGVDSAVAALLLKRQGHEVHAAYFRTWMNEEGLPFPGECPWEEDVRNARAVAEHLALPFRVLDLVADYRRTVVEYLVEGYRRGLTPNPDIVCNREMKFGVFLRRAVDEGYDAIATGHYARRRANADGTFDLLEGADPNKDQSYFLAMIRQDQLARALFPVGELLKPDVRQMAAEAGLPNAARKDSQGICFLGQVPVQDFLERHIPDSPGPIVNAAGKAIGQHRGLHRYTIGQRKGIGLPSNTDHEYFVVVKKDFATNTLHVAFDKPDAPWLYTAEAVARDFTWINRPVVGEQDILARVRYRDKATPARFVPQADGTVRLRFAETQRGLAPGQVLAVYHDRVLMGGGVFV
ncbi:MAG: tRNA 2-thiouridine(34) synthase MnmA [Verrucomicrobiota bacterium]